MTTKRVRTIFLSLGSNIEPQKNVPACLEILKKEFCVKKISSIYETDPAGPSGDKKFWNAAVEIETVLDKKKLTEKLRQIEERLGRRRDPAEKFAPRTIDIDILPAPGYQKQSFVMIPLAEIAPEEMDSETGKTFREIAKEINAGVRSIHLTNVKCIDLTPDLS